MNFFYKRKIDLIYILILLVPILAVLSIFFLELCLLIVSIVFLYKVFKEKKFQYFNNFFFKFSLIFYFYLLINYIFNVGNLETLSIIFYFRYTIYVLSIYYFLDHKKNLFKDFLLVISFLIFFLFFDAIFQSIFKVNIVGLKIIEKHRVSSFFGSELILGSYIFRILPFIFLILFLKQNLLNNLSRFILFFSSILIVFLSGERIAITLSLFLFFLNIIFFYKEKNFQFLKKVSLLALLIVFIIISFSKDYKYRYFYQPLNDLSKNYKVTKDLLKKYDTEPKIIFFSGLHHNLMLTSFRIYKSNKIFGSGPRSFRNVCKDFKINKYSCDRHPHHFYIQMLAETGLVGLSFLIFIYFLIIFMIFKLNNNQTKNYKFKISILLFYFVALFPLIPSGNFFNNWLSIMIYLPFSFYLFLNKVTDEKIIS